MFAGLGQLPCARPNFKELQPKICRGGGVPGGLPDCSLVSLGAAAGRLAHRTAIRSTLV